MYSLQLIPRQRQEPKLMLALSLCCTECGAIMNKRPEMATDDDVSAAYVAAAGLGYDPNRAGWIYQNCKKCGRFYCRKQTYAERLLREKIESGEIEPK